MDGCSPRQDWNCHLRPAPSCGSSLSPLPCLACAPDDRGAGVSSEGSTVSSVPSPPVPGRSCCSLWGPLLCPQVAPSLTWEPGFRFIVPRMSPGVSWVLSPLACPLRSVPPPASPSSAQLSPPPFLPAPAPGRRLQVLPWVHGGPGPLTPHPPQHLGHFPFQVAWFMGRALAWKQSPERSVTTLQSSVPATAGIPQAHIHPSWASFLPTQGFIRCQDFPTRQILL